MKKNEIGFCAAEILLPDFEVTDGTRWAAVACDQYTSEPQYWKQAEETVGDAPSTLRMILPEVYLSEAKSRIGAINRQMEVYLSTVLRSYPNAMICLSRTQSDGKIRRGIIGAVDLECYDYNKGATSLTRATEGTVLERIPPRVEIRRDAALEMPHIMLLIDDPDRTVIEPTVASCEAREPIYDFDLMLGGGHVRAHLMTEAEQNAVLEALASLATPEAMKARYGDGVTSTLLFAVGDGNHSLATAKAVYEQLKASIGEEAAKAHPARYALAEVVNLHDDALQFEPIYRVVFGCDPAALLADLKEYLASLSGNAAPQTMRCILPDGECDLTAEHPALQLTVGTLQAFLFDYSARHPEVEVDYIHGEDSLRSLVNRPDVIGFLFDGMEKADLFRTVLFDGALPRKTFSMGHANDKRFYIECRKIK
ncbi:MAG: DUF1015 domain-containing protein [Clostridia bacterium]|nr:DUF1015 domain-containing protein [Clostridia bacterium]